MQQLPSARLREGPVTGPAAVPHGGAAGPTPFWVRTGLQAYRLHQSGRSITS